MWNNPQLYMVLGAALGATLVGLKNADRTYRHRRERKRRQQVAKFARQRGLTLLDDAVPDHIQSRADLYRGREYEATVSDLILGKDVEGTYYVVRRQVEGDRHYALCFDTKAGSKLEGFRIEPILDGEVRTRAFSNLWQRLRRRRPDHCTLRMVWDVPSARFVDDATLAAVGAILKHTTGIAEAPQGMVLGVSIENRQILIHSTSVGDLEALDAFIQNAVSLRLALIASVRDSSATRTVKVGGTVRGDVIAAARKPVADPSFRPPEVAVGAAAPGAPSGAGTAAPPLQPAGQRAGTDKATSSSGPNPVALGLSTPRSRSDSGSWGWTVRNGKRVFEVPEPEEDVVVYVGHGR